MRAPYLDVEDEGQEVPSAFVHLPVTVLRASGRKASLVHSRTVYTGSTQFVCQTVPWVCDAGPDLIRAWWRKCTARGWWRACKGNADDLSNAFHVRTVSRGSLSAPEKLNNATITTTFRYQVVYPGRSDRTELVHAPSHPCCEWCSQLSFFYRSVNSCCTFIPASRCPRQGRRPSTCGQGVASNPSNGPKKTCASSGRCLGRPFWTRYG